MKNKKKHYFKDCQLKVISDQTDRWKSSEQRISEELKKNGLI